MTLTLFPCSQWSLTCLVFYKSYLLCSVWFLIHLNLENKCCPFLSLMFSNKDPGKHNLSIHLWGEWLLEASWKDWITSTQMCPHAFIQSLELRMLTFARIVQFIILVLTTRTSWCCFYLWLLFLGCDGWWLFFLEFESQSKLFNRLTECNFYMVYKYHFVHTDALPLLTLQFDVIQSPSQQLTWLSAV